MPSAVCFGEIVVDEYPDRRVPAGAPLHVAAQLVGRGWDAHLVTAVGRDSDATLLLDAVRESGVDDSLVERNLLPTGTVEIDLSGGGPSFDIATPAAWDAVTGPAFLPIHDVFYFGSLAARDRRSRSTLYRLLAGSGAEWKVCDVNLRPPYTPNPLVVEVMARATLVKVSSGELDTLGCDRLDDVLRLAPAAEYAVVTLGAEGAAMVSRAGSRWSVPGKSTDVVDTVGAGDAFTAGLIDALVTGAKPIDALIAARDRSVETLSRRGGLP